MRHFLDEADLIFGIGCSFATTELRRADAARARRIIHATLDPADLNKDMPAEHALVGDAELTLRRADRRGHATGSSGKPRGRRRARSPPRSRAIKAEWLGAVDAAS